MTLVFLLLSCSGTTNASSPTTDRPVIASESTDEQTENPRWQVLPVGATVDVGETTIELEIARTPRQQAMGLMFRDRMERDRGMLFPFSPPQPTNFWMKNTLIPLDMIFLRNGEVMYIAEDVPPCPPLAASCPSYGPDGTVLIDNVIELNAGRADELGLEVGDRLEIEYLE